MLTYRSDLSRSRTGIHGGLRRGGAAAALGAVLVLGAGVPASQADDKSGPHQPDVRASVNAQLRLDDGRLRDLLGDAAAAAAWPQATAVPGATTASPVPAAPTTTPAPPSPVPAFPSPSPDATSSPPAATVAPTPAPTASSPVSAAPSSPAAGTAAPTPAPATSSGEATPTAAPLQQPNAGDGAGAPSAQPGTSGVESGTPSAGQAAAQPGGAAAAADPGTTASGTPSTAAPGPARTGLPQAAGVPAASRQDMTQAEPAAEAAKVWLGVGLVGSAGAAGLVFTRIRRF